MTWCDERGLTRPAEITRPIIERYQRHLFLKRKANGAPLSATTQASRITPIRKWFRWLVRQNRILYNPAADLDLPKVEERLPSDAGRSLPRWSEAYAIRALQRAARSFAVRLGPDSSKVLGVLLWITLSQSRRGFLRIARAHRRLQLPKPYPDWLN